MQKYKQKNNGDNEKNRFSLFVELNGNIKNTYMLVFHLDHEI